MLTTRQRPDYSSTKLFSANLGSQKHEFAAIFGRTAAEPFDELWKVRIEINGAVFEMIRNKELQESRTLEYRDLWKEYYYTAFSPSDEAKDKIASRIAIQVAKMEDICRPAIEARSRSR